MKRSAFIIECPLPTRKDFQNLTGRKFGRLTVLGFAGRLKSGKSAYWFCRCVCQKESTVGARHLKSGHTTSCGCFNNERKFFRNHIHGLSKTLEYKSWAHMLDRCCNPDDEAFKNYGGRGIRVCKEWLDFENFYKDMGKKPTPRHMIERSNNDGNYEPSNCVWATKWEQAKNKRSVRWITLAGKTQRIMDWAKEVGIRTSVITRRIKRGWSAKDAVLIPWGFRWKKGQHTKPS